MSNRQITVRATSRTCELPRRGLSVLLLVFGLTLLVALPLAARQSFERLPLELRLSGAGVLYRVMLADATIHYVRIASGGDPVRLGLATGGVLEVDRSRIIRMERVRGVMVDADYWPQDANHTRLIFAPTARTLPRGKGTINAYYGVLPFVGIGLTDRFSMAGGTPILDSGDMSLFPASPGDTDAGSGRLLYLAPKLQLFSIGRLETAAGALAFLRTEDLSNPRGLAYGVATWSPAIHTGITAGAGWGLTEGGRDARPALLAGADHRVNRRVKLLTENYYFSSGDVIGSAGVRILGERVSGDVALATRRGEKQSTFPVFNVSYGW